MFGEKNLALLETKALVSELLPRFKFTLVPNHEITYRVTIILVLKYGLLMTVTHRSK